LEKEAVDSDMNDQDMGCKNNKSTGWETIEPSRPCDGDMSFLLWLNFFLEKRRKFFNRLIKKIFKNK
jgi:hypothetical protein